jgi:hypothetical protein
MKETTSQREAEVSAYKIIGSTIERQTGATATINFKNKVVKIPADYANTDFSPVYDKEGSARKIHEDEGVEAEYITPEMVAAFDERQEIDESDPEAWKYE